MKKTVYLGLVILIAIALYVFYRNFSMRNQYVSHSHGGPVKDYVSLIDTLRGKGRKVTPKGSITQPFFSVNGYIISVDEEDVQVFEYASTNEAEKEAQKVSPDGGSVGTSMMSWVDTPHFYKKERIIVIYIGDNRKILDSLNSAVGQQFAGR